MHWAVDRFGEVVAATDSVVYSAPFTCPTCGEPVYHRHGFERRPHFAHYHMGSDWLCENYFPSEVGATDNPSSSRKRSSILRAAPYAGARLCIENAETRHANLLLRLPASWALSSAVSITIESNLGQQRILSKDTQKRKFVRLPWSVPVGRCSVENDDGGIELDIREALENFRHNGNFFMSVHDRGTLLDEMDDLEVGRSYWLIAQRGPSVADLPRSVSLEKLDGPAIGWQKFRLNLPDCERSLAEMTAIERILGRQIRRRNMPPRVAWPIPVRFAPDGVAVYGREARYFYVEWSGGGELSVERDGQDVTLSATSVPGRFSLSNPEDGEYALRINGMIASQFRLEATDPFRPNGVQVERDGKATELFEHEEIADLKSSQRDIRTVVPSTRIWRSAKVNGAKVKELPDKNDFEFASEVHEVDFGAFGLVPVPRIPEINVETIATARIGATRTSRASLKGLALRFSGAEAAIEILGLESLSDCHQWANKYRLQWMLPQVVRSVCKDRTK